MDTPPLDPVRRRYRRSVLRVLWVRHHALLLVAGVTGAALALNRLWWGLGFTHLVGRSLFNCLVTWGLFLLGARAWIVYAHAADRRLAVLPPDDAAAAPPDRIVPAREAAGGGGDAAEGALQVAQAVAEVAGEAEGVGAILGGVALAIAGLVALAAVVPWLWVEVPALLVEAAFQVALSASLVRRAGRLVPAAAGPGWLPVMIAGTWKPMALVTLVVLLATLTAQLACDAPGRLLGCFVGEG